MVEYSGTQVSHGSLIVSTLAAHLMLALPAAASAWPVEPETVRIAGQRGTFGSAIVVRPSRSLVSFYSELLAKQQRLDAESERILFENLQELYLR
jgi:hypothetical protein